MPDSAPIDEAALAATTGGDPALALELLRIFRDEVSGVARSLAAGDGGANREALAHKIRGSALAIGARPVARLAEAVGQGTPADDYRRALDALSQEIDRRLAAR